VEENGWALEFVPTGLKTTEICLEAVKGDSSALKFVPKSLQAQTKKAAGIG
jgi:hypothetical protein